ncbi:electrogenic sodium bicarbonate cotransporter 4, partial [Lates japonicus]
EVNPYSTVSSDQNELDRSITLHLKISCPPSPVHSQTSLTPGDAPSHLPPRQPLPQVSIRVESDSGSALLRTTSAAARPLLPSRPAAT